MATRTVLLAKLEVAREQSQGICDLFHAANVGAGYSTRSDHHCTVLYATAPPGGPPAEETVTLFSHRAGITGVTSFGDAVVCLIDDSQGVLRDLHAAQAKKFGAIHDYPVFTPHVTVAYRAGGLAAEDMETLTSRFVGSGLVIGFDRLKTKLLFDAPAAQA